MQKCAREFIMFLNNDTQVQDSWLQKSALQLMDAPGLGCQAPNPVRRKLAGGWQWDCVAGTGQRGTIGAGKADKRVQL